MATWGEFCAAEPDLARRVRERLTAHKHLTMATLRADGAPRISGTELDVREDDVWLGSMPGARKAADLRRDPRVAVHGASEDPPDWRADAKIAGRALEVTDESAKRAYAGTAEGKDHPAFELFRIELDEVVLVSLGDPADHLVIETWRPGRGVTRIERR